MKRIACFGLLVVVLGLVTSACASSTQSGSSPTPASTATRAPSASPNADAPSEDVVRQAAEIVGGGDQPGYTVAVLDGWGVHGGFVIKYASAGPGPVLGISVWDVGRVFRDPCRWHGQAYDPGPGVNDLVKALVAQPMRNATKPNDVTLAGYQGRYLELSVPADQKSSTWTDFDACDVDAEGHRDFQGWLGRKGGNRYEQVPGQVDRLWVLDVAGRRLVVDATYSPDIQQGDRRELQRVVQSIRFEKGGGGTQ